MQMQVICGCKESNEEFLVSDFGIPKDPQAELGGKVLIDGFGYNSNDLSHKDKIVGRSGAFLYLPCGGSDPCLAKLCFSPEARSIDLTEFSCLASGSRFINTEFFNAIQKYMKIDFYKGREYITKFEKFRLCISNNNLNIDLRASLEMTEIDIESATNIVAYAMKLVDNKFFIAPVVIPVVNCTIDCSTSVQIERWYQVYDPRDPDLHKVTAEAIEKSQTNSDSGKTIDNERKENPDDDTKISSENSHEDVETIEKPQTDLDSGKVIDNEQKENVGDSAEISSENSHNDTETTQKPQIIPDQEVTQELTQEVTQEVTPSEVIEGTEAIEKLQTDLMQNQNSDSSVNKPEFDKIETKSKIISFVLFLLIAAGVTSLAILKSINLCKIIIPCIGLATIAFGISLVFCFAEDIFNSCVNKEHQEKINNGEHQIKAPLFARLFVNDKTFQELAMLSHEPQNESQTIEHQKN
jgi:hypothetical protein